MVMMCPWRIYALSVFSVYTHRSSAFITTSSPFAVRCDTKIYESASSGSCSIHTSKITTASGKPVCRYALGGAARSVQPESLAMKYRDILSEKAAPFYFYYNPARYPLFLSGLGKSFCNDKTSNNYRENMFIASGGTEFSSKALDERLNDALAHSGGEYLDAFVLEYVCPDELVSDNKQIGRELSQAIEHVHNKMKREGRVRYVMASTHSHLVGKVLASTTLPSSDTPAFDALMLRYNMSHKNAAESLSLPSAIQNNVPILAFTTTRWNRLQSDPPMATDPYPTTADCLKFALQHPAVEIVLHSARDENELNDAILPLLSCSTSEQPNWLTANEYKQWRTYGSDENEWNEGDSFDEYPSEIN